MKGKNIVFVFWTMVFTLFVSTEAKGSSSGGGGGRSGSGSGRGGLGKFSGKRAAIPAAGIAGYAAYKVAHPHPASRFHSNPLENPAFLSGGGATLEDLDYKIQESTYYNRREGLGMSAFGLLALILGIIGIATLAWFCYMIGVPLWKDRNRRNRNATEGHPLQETPSTATPSP